MTPKDAARVQAYLRGLLGNARVGVALPSRRGASAEVRIGDEFIGTLHKDEEDGETSFSLHVTILEEDLPAG